MLWQHDRLKAALRSVLYPLSLISNNPIERYTSDAHSGTGAVTPAPMRQYLSYQLAIKTAIYRTVGHGRRGGTFLFITSESSVFSVAMITNRYQIRPDERTQRRKAAPWIRWIRFLASYAALRVRI